MNRLRPVLRRHRIPLLLLGFCLAYLAIAFSRDTCSPCLAGSFFPDHAFAGQMP